MQENQFDVVRYFNDEITYLYRFKHNDITSNHFLRTWTEVAWTNLREFLAETGMEMCSQPAFRDLKENIGFTPPLSVTITDGWEYHIVKYYVIERLLWSCCPPP